MNDSKNAQCCVRKKTKDLLVNLDFNEELALIAKALGHPARVKILQILAKKQSCLCGEIVDLVDDLAQSTVSQHLKILKEANLISGEISGPSVCYCLERDGLKRLMELVKNI